MKRSRQILMGLVALAVGAGAALYHLNRIDEAPLEANESVQISPALVERGEYLARVGNCMACHTVAGQKSFSGGRPIETPFGIIYSSNLTPSIKSGIGQEIDVAKRGGASHRRKSFLPLPSGLLHGFGPG